MRKFLSGIIVLLALEALAGVVWIRTSNGFSAAAEPSAPERWIARQARMAAMPTDAKTRVNPVKNSADVLADAREHWADHCASCHANDGSGDTPMGRHTFPPAPDMRAPETQQMTDGELFYVIQNGVRMTAMPAWGTAGSGHDAEDSWKLVYFIRHLPALTFEEKKEMEKLNPKAPDDIKEEEEEQKFLKGEDDTHEQSTQHHHH